MSIPKYNPAPITTVYRVAVLNASDHCVAEFETLPGPLGPERQATAQSIADRVPDGYAVQVFLGVYTIGRSTPGDRRIRWEG